MKLLLIDWDTNIKVLQEAQQLAKQYPEFQLFVQELKEAIPFYWHQEQEYMHKYCSILGDNSVRTEVAKFTNKSVVDKGSRAINEVLTNFRQELVARTELLKTHQFVASDSLIKTSYHPYLASFELAILKAQCMLKNNPLQAAGCLEALKRPTLIGLKDSITKAIKILAEWQPGTMLLPITEKIKVSPALATANINSDIIKSLLVANLNLIKARYKQLLTSYYDLKKQVDEKLVAKRVSTEQATADNGNVPLSQIITNNPIVGAITTNAASGGLRIFPGSNVTTVGICTPLNAVSHNGDSGYTLATASSAPVVDVPKLNQELEEKEEYIVVEQDQLLPVVNPLQFSVRTLDMADFEILSNPDKELAMDEIEDELLAITTLTIGS